MLTRRGRTRAGAAVALAAVLVLVVAAPAGAAGWGGRSEARELAGGLLPRVLAWLGLAPDQGAALKCDQGSSIDPNGCPKAAGERGRGTSHTVRTRTAQAEEFVFNRRF